MKSLEILDDIRLDLENYLDYLERDLQTRIKNNESEMSINEVDDAKVILVINMYDGYTKIKQDLEVLEILRKHIHLRRFENMNRNEVMISPLISENERDKLKQWLEENENDN